MEKKEILLYGSINEFSAAKFIDDVNEMQADDEILVRVNTSGGSPEYGWGMVAKFREFKGVKSIRVDGKAHSTGMYFVAYAKNVEAHDFSQFIIHRASYPEWFENQSELFTASLRENLINVNKSLEAAFRAKVDVKMLEEMKAIKVKDIFDMEQRIDVVLTAKEAKKIGLISKVIMIKPEAKAELMAMYEMEAHAPTKHRKEKVILTKNSKKMETLQELKEKSPAIYAQAVGVGVSQEKDRAGAWMVFNAIDPTAVAKGINSGENISMTAQSEFAIKQMTVKTVAEITAEAAEKLKTPKVKTIEEIAAEVAAKNNGGKTPELSEEAIIEAKMLEEVGLSTKQEKS